MNKFTDAAVRAFRTFVQGVVTSILSGGVIAAVAATGSVDVNALKVMAIAAGFSGLVAVVSFIQNTLEDKGVIKSTKG
jgi:hypothetical protein